MAPKKKLADFLNKRKELTGKSKTHINLSETMQEKIRLYERMITGQATVRELVRLSLLMGMITTEQYAIFLEIEQNYPED